MDKTKLHFETLQLHAGQELPDPTTGARAVPIYQTASYVFHDCRHAADRFALRDAGNIYGRLTNDTQRVLEERMATLEGGVAALAVASGAAAVTYALQNILHAGDHLVAADNLYGGSYNLITHTLAEQGITHTIIRINDLHALEAAIRPETKAVYAETFGNPHSDITHIEAVAEVAHRHGLTLGELANLYHSEIGAKYPLHVISAMASESGRRLMPWTIAPASDIPGLFTCDMYSGGGLWNNTNVTPGIGTSRPYEYIGAPFVKTDRFEPLPQPAGVLMRPCSFTPACGKYAGHKCYGYQIILEPGAEYHSLMHTLQLMRHFHERYPVFELYGEFYSKLADPVLAGFVEGAVSAEEARSHMKTEEQKWIRKAKKYALYENLPYRIK